MRLTRFLLNREFVDKSVITNDIIKLRFCAGNGGRGISRYNGIGGNGGSVYLRVHPVLSFKEFIGRFESACHVVKAEHGESSQQVKLAGRHGAVKFLDVPFGVECVDESSMLLARCTSLKKPYLVARGGEGGCAATNYEPTTGESVSAVIHLKLRPNVGFLGFPNAGKSTLLKALVPEKPVKIASYPFTTLKPQLCYLKMDNQKNEMNKENLMSKYAYKMPPFTMSVADLPGIIEGASRNRGVGHAFLKHLEYSEIIAIVVDVHGFQLNASLSEPFRTPLETVALLNREAENYSKKLLQKKYILILNKIDIMNGEEKAKEISELFRGTSKLDRQRWVVHVPKALRPARPIAFENVVCISAKNTELANLITVFREVHDSIHTPKRIILPEEVEEKNRTVLL